MADLEAVGNAQRFPWSPYEFLLPKQMERYRTGCFRAPVEDGHTREVCVEVLSQVEARQASFGRYRECDPATLSPPDCVAYEEVRTDSLEFGGKTAVREWALMSGGIGHYRDQPQILMRIPVEADSVAVFHWRFVLGFSDTTTARLVGQTLARIEEP